MALKYWLRIGLVSGLLLAGCVQPTPTPPPSVTPVLPGAGTAYPALPPTVTPQPANYPAPSPTPIPRPNTAYPAPTPTR